MKDSTTTYIAAALCGVVMIGFWTGGVMPMAAALILFRAAMLTEKDHLRLMILTRGNNQVGRNLVSGRDEWAARKAISFHEYKYRNPFAEAYNMGNAYYDNKDSGQEWGRAAMPVQDYSDLVDNWQRAMVNKHGRDNL